MNALMEVSAPVMGNGAELKDAKVSNRIASGINPRILNEVRRMVENASKEQKVLMSVEKYHFF